MNTGTVLSESKHTAKSETHQLLKLSTHKHEHVQTQTDMTFDKGRMQVYSALSNSQQSPTHAFHNLDEELLCGVDGYSSSHGGNTIM